MNINFSNTVESLIFNNPFCFPLALRDLATSELLYEVAPTLLLEGIITLEYGEDVTSLLGLVLGPCLISSVN